MNTVVTSREEILKKSRQLICEKGVSGLNIRNVASACNVSVGSIYNYFGSKAELTQAVVESIWGEIFNLSEGHGFAAATDECVAWIFDRMEYGCKAYPGFFTIHSLMFMKDGKDQGKAKMEATWRHIMSGLEMVMARDKKVRRGAFDGEFTPAKFANVLFSLMLAALLREDYDAAPIIEMVRRTLY